MFELHMMVKLLIGVKRGIKLVVVDVVELSVIENDTNIGRMRLEDAFSFPLTRK